MGEDFKSKDACAEPILKLTSVRGADISLDVTIEFHRKTACQQRSLTGKYHVG